LWIATRRRPGRLGINDVQSEAMSRVVVTGVAKYRKPRPHGTDYGGDVRWSSVSRTLCWGGGLGLELATLVIQGDVTALGHGGGRVFLGGTEPRVLKEGANGARLGEEGNQLHQGATVLASQGVRRVHFVDQPCPGRGSGTRLRSGFPPLVASGASSAGVDTIEKGAMLPGIRDVIGKARQPFEGIHRLKVSPEARIHLRMIQDGLFPIDVNELLQAEGISDKVGGDILEGLVVLGRDRLADKGGEARPPPLKELLRELAGDGVFVHKTREQTLSE